MSNPYPRAERYRHVAIERLDGWVHSWWVCAHERRLSGAADLRLAASAALRIRHGARAACKRLRGERDEARGGYRWMIEHAADQKLDGYRELGARAAAAENERDAARLERDSGAGKVPTYSEPTGGGDFDELCTACNEPVPEPHTWSECARKLADHRDHLLGFAATLEHERDAARLELRALEWLVVHHPDELRALVLADGSGRYSYCARALGWEG